MSFTLADILVRFRSQSSEVDNAFTRVEGQAVQFARRMQGRLRLPFDGDVGGLEAAFGQAESGAVAMIGRVKGFLSQALVVTTGNFLTDMIRQGVGMVKGSIIGMNASLESTTLQFTTLMKDADLARQHVKDLFIFAKDTPFETMPIINASRMLQTFGGNALNTKEHLRTVGDAAAAVSQDIGRVAFWYGRMNNAIKGGTAWGEAGMVLQEMGVLTAEMRTQMEQMKKAGADGAAIWGVFANQMSTFDGAMKRMAGTWAGLTSTIADTVNISGATIFKPLFDMAKEALMVVANLLSSTRFDAFVQEAARAVGQLASAVQVGLEAVLPIASLIWGTFEPMVRIAWEWGSGFVNAFAGGISSAVGFVADAIGGLADMITYFLEPHSPPKILPNLDKWGLKTAQVWMNAWGNVDYGVFETMGQAIGSALQNMVGSGKLSEQQEIPMLSRTKAVLAELVEGFRTTGEVSQSTLDRLRQAAGPAGNAVGQLAEGYLRVEQASRAVAAAQESLNDVTERYDRIINPLSAELDGVRRRMQGLQDAQRMAELKQKLGTATGSDREMIVLQMRELALNRQISAEQDAKTKAQATAEAKVKAAQKDQEAAKKSLDTVQARQKVEAESVAMARQQVSLLSQLAKNTAGAGEAAKDAAAGIKGAIDDSKTDIGIMQARVGKLGDQMEAMRLKGEKIGNAIAAPFRLLRKGIEAVVGFAGLKDLPGMLQRVGEGVRYLATGKMSEAFAKAVPGGEAFLKRLVSWRYHLVKFGIDAKATFDAVRAGLVYLATGQAGAALTRMFGPDSAVLKGLVTVRYAIVRFGFEAVRAFAAVKDGARFLISGELPVSLVRYFGEGSPVLVGLVAIRARLVEFGANAIHAWTLFRSAASFLLTGQLNEGMTRLLESGSLVATWLLRLHHLIVTIGPAAVAEFTKIKAALASAFSDPRGALAGLWTMFKSLGAEAVATGRESAAQLLQGLVNALPEGLRTRLAALKGPLAGGLAAAFGGLTLGPMLAGLLLPLGGLLAPLAGLLAPIGLLFGKLGGIFGFLAPSAGGLAVAFKSLLNPLALLKGGFGGIIGFLGPLGLMMIQYVKTPLAMIAPLFAGLIPMLKGGFLGALKNIGPMLLGLKNPIGLIFSLGRTVLGLASPFGIIVALVGAFAGAFATNFGGIRDLTETALGPLLQILQQLGPIFGTIVQMFVTGDWTGGLAVLKAQFGDLGPLFTQAAGTLQTGIPAIFAVLMQYIGGIGTKIIGWIGAILPPIITKLGEWAMAFLSWVAPMIPPMLAALGGLIGQLLQAVGAALPGIVEALAPVAAAFVDWVLTAGPPLLMQLGSLIGQLLGWVALQIPPIACQLGVWALQFLGWVAPMIPKFLVALGSVLAAFLGWIIEKGPDILTGLGEWAKQFGTWALTSGIPALLGALGTMFTGLWTELQRLWKNAFAEGSIGKSLMDGLINGIRNGWSSFVSWFVGLLRAAVPDWAEGFLGNDGKEQPPPPPPPLPPGNTSTTGTSGTGSPSTGSPAGRQRYGGGRAGGGDVRRGNFYLVGEDGPEYFEPDADGAIHPNSVYRAINDPLAGLGGIGQGGAPTPPPSRVSLPTTAPAAPGASGGDGATVSVSLTINNPVVDSDERYERLKREIVKLAGGEFAAAVNRLLLAEG